MNEQKPPGGIEWTRPYGRRGYTINVVGGCTHGCRWEMPDGNIAQCYAKDIALRFTTAYPKGFEHIYWRPHLLKGPAKIKEPACFFIDSMSDLMDRHVEDWQVEAVLDMCRQSPQHIFQLLTKNAPRLLKFDFPPNVWVGVSTPPDWMHDPENYEKRLSDSAKEGYMYRALKVLSLIDVPVRWMSFEPLNMDFSEIVEANPNALQWATVGAASDGRRLYPPDAMDFVFLMDELDSQNVPVFFKGNMKVLPSAARFWRAEFPEIEEVKG